eukprot:9607870-Alexandrium_andersonii.AAC.1
MASRMASWPGWAAPSETQLVAEADTPPELAEDSGRTLATSTGSMDLEEDIPDVNTCTARGQGADGPSRAY